MQLIAGDRVTLRGGRVVYKIVLAPGDFIDPAIWAWKLASESSGRSSLIEDDTQLHLTRRPATSGDQEHSLF